MNKNTLSNKLLSILLCTCIAVSFCLGFSGCSGSGTNANNSSVVTAAVSSGIPAFSGKPYIEINNNKPYFEASEITSKSFEQYSPLDSLGRCGTAVSSVGQDIMPTEKRGSISEVKPTAWQLVKYDFIDGKYLFNRCHLLGYQLTGENANERNLITGTRYMNTEGMLPFENMVADYVKETDNHVMYRVTPLFSGDNLLADGVIMEAYSVEDSGSAISFNVFCYNVQPGVYLDYTNGNNYQSDSVSYLPIAASSVAVASKSSSSPSSSSKTVSSQSSSSENTSTYILNTNSKKFHKPDCGSVSQIKDSNKSEYTGSREDLILDGYSPCKTCNP